MGITAVLALKAAESEEARKQGVRSFFEASFSFLQGALEHPVAALRLLPESQMQPAQS